MNISGNQLSSKYHYLITFLILAMLVIPFSYLSSAFAQEGVIDTIPAEVVPVGVGFNPANENMYASISRPNLVIVIDSDTNEVIENITVPSSPVDFAYDPVNQNMYVTSLTSNSVFVIDSDTNEVIDTIAVGEFPSGIAYNPDNGNMYVTNTRQGTNTISVIDTDTNDVIDTIQVSGPAAIAYNPDNGNMYVTKLDDSSSVAVIDSETNEVIDTIGVGIAPVGIAYNSDNGNMYVTNFFSGTVSVIDSDTNEEIDTIGVGTQPIGIAYNSDNGNMYVVNQGSQSVSVINTTTSEVIDNIQVGEDPRQIGYNPANGYMYVVNQQSGTISVIGLIRPTANAGPDQTVDSGDTVQLDGSGSTDQSGSSLTYKWTQISGPEVALSDSTSVNPTFIAPNTNTEEDLIFELVVTNGEGAVSKPDSVTITVNPSNNPPSPFKGILGSGNNINIQVQENSGNNVGGQSDFGGTYSDSPILQDQSTNQDSNVVS